MAVRVRAATAAEVMHFLELWPETMGSATVGREAALRAWKSIVQHPYFVTAVVEADPPMDGQRLVGFGSACFVSAAFSDDAIQNPRPGLNDRFIAACAAGNGFLNRQQIAACNARMGVDVLQTHGNAVKGPTEAQQGEIYAALALAFFHLVRGYRLRTVLAERSSEFHERYVRRVSTQIVEFPEAGRLLRYTTREGAESIPGSIPFLLYQYAEPTLGLTTADQDLMRTALEGATDEDLAAALSLRMPTVKARWRSMFSRIEEAKPEWSRKNEGSVRGAQRRHRILAYCREHPEELRPYDWSARG